MATEYLPCIELVSKNSGELCHRTAAVIDRITLGSVTLTRTLCPEGHMVDVDQDRVAKIATYTVRPLADCVLEHFPVPDTVPESWLSS